MGPFSWQTNWDSSPTFSFLIFTFRSLKSKYFSYGNLQSHFLTIHKLWRCHSRFLPSNNDQNLTTYYSLFHMTYFNTPVRQAFDCLSWGVNVAFRENAFYIGKTELSIASYRERRDSNDKLVFLKSSISLILSTSPLKMINTHSEHSLTYPKHLTPSIIQYC